MSLGLSATRAARDISRTTIPMSKQKIDGLMILSFEAGKEMVAQCIRALRP